MKKILKYVLKILARRQLRAHRPRLVGLTGSVGKTSAKEAIYAVLKNHFTVRRNIKNYNNELGVPLTIIGAESAGHSWLGWLKIIFRAILTGPKDEYPQILILEMGVDHPGDLDYFSDFIRTRVALITAIGPAHLEFFGTLEQIKNEKQKIFRNLIPDGQAILNADTIFAKEITKDYPGRIFSYGLKDKTDFQAKEIRFSLGPRGQNGLKAFENEIGISFKLIHKGSAVPVFLPGFFGHNAVYAALAGAAVGVSFGLNLIEIAIGLKEFKPPKGRMNLLAGLNGSLIVDDTYNASPLSMANGLEDTAANFSRKYRKIAVLGDMLELGPDRVKEHEKIGALVANLEYDFLAAIGDLAGNYIQGAQRSGFPEKKLLHFKNHDEALDFLWRELKNNDIIYVKGSQGARMEKIVKGLMPEPAQAAACLVRQEKEWQEK